MKEPDFPGDRFSGPEGCQGVMLAFYDLVSDANVAGFPDELTQELEGLRLRFLDEFERVHPGYGKGRAVSR
jgi:hypothetical protein